MHEYERQWSRAGGHACGIRCDSRWSSSSHGAPKRCSTEQFDARLEAAQTSDDIGESLLAEELLPLWRTVCAGGELPFVPD